MICLISTMPSQSKSSARKSGSKNAKQIIVLVGLLLALICLSIATSFIVVVGPDEEEEASFRSVRSIMDAMRLCENRIDVDYGSRLQTAIFDDRSSFSDTSSGLFKLFYEVHLFREESKRSGITGYYATCFVSGTGEVKKLNLSQQKDFVPTPIRRAREDDDEI